MPEKVIQPVIQAKNISKFYPSGFRSQNKKAVLNGVSLSIDRDETLGLTGPSGCGKSTLAKALLQLIPFDEGSIVFNGKDITGLSHRELQKLRIKMQIMFQHPDSSLNPRMKIYDCIAELMRIHKITGKKSEDERHKVMELLKLVGLQEEHLKRFPGELSGGQVQRVVLARVLSVGPELLIADEPTSMLDVSVQAQILSLLKTMQKRFGFACLFISHDLDVIRAVCGQTAVMHQGGIVEIGSTSEVLGQPRHPYTMELVRRFDAM